MIKSWWDLLVPETFGLLRSPHHCFDPSIWPVYRPPSPPLTNFPEGRGTQATSILPIYESVFVQLKLYCYSQV